MTATAPRLVLLEPFVLDHRRVTLTLKTADLPPRSNIPACMVNFAAPAAKPNATPAAPLDFEIGAPTSPPPPLPKAPQTNGDAGDDPFEDTPYPNVELSLLDADDNEIAQAIIIDHQEEEISFTLHIRNPQLGHTYIARADMIHHRELLQTLDAPFVLEVSGSDIE